VEYTIGVCFVFAVECHFSFQEIVCRREEELDDEGVIKKNLEKWFYFSSFSLILIVESHRMRPWIEPALKIFFSCFRFSYCPYWCSEK